MVLSCQNMGKMFSEKSILKGITFYVEDYDKVAVVGVNGAGKTTLLKVIVGELAADEGEAVLSKGKTLGYLAQTGAVDGGNTIYQELLSVKTGLVQLEKQIRDTELRMKDAGDAELPQLLEAYARFTHDYEFAGGYAYRSELVGVLKGLGFTEEEFDKAVDRLSGGQKTRVALGKLLLEKPDLIILDEPTNHLDMSSIRWLETYLLNYKGAVMIVSHDRYFLDRIANKVVELDNSRGIVFSGNYSDYVGKKEQLRSAEWKAYWNQQQEIKHQEAVIAKLRSFNREKSVKRAESREKMLQKIEVRERPTEQSSDIHMELNPSCVSGNDVLSVTGLTKAFGALTLFQDVSLEIKRGEHVAVIGDNGTGKTTLLKILNGILPTDRGDFTLGTNVKIGYYDQEHQVLDPAKSLFDEISDAYPSLNNTEIRNVLAAFLFVGDEVFKKIGDLSGGERGRVALAKLMLSEANFLVLDEPTNHLDIMSKEILEVALNRYTGTVLYVSHDRYFINRTASRILDLSERQFINYIGNYDYYLEKNLEKELDKNPEGNSGKVTGKKGNANGVDTAQPDRAETENKSEYFRRKEQQSQLRKKENALKRLENQITELEEKLAALDRQMLLPELATDVGELVRLTSERTAIDSQLSLLYEDWESAALMT